MGQFSVDRTLTNITKGRVMDNGVGIDLICVGQEPLYAVPLFLVSRTYNILSVNIYTIQVYSTVVYLGFFSRG